MDTRNKILTPAGARGIPTRPIAMVAGTFDVLRAEHVRLLDEARVRSSAAALLVFVLPHAGELLPQRARAQLVAALRAVDYVVSGNVAEFEGLVSTLEPAQVVRLEDVDERLSRDLRRRVLEIRGT